MKEFEELLSLARNSIEKEFNWEKPVVSNIIKNKYSSKLACFVTLTKNNELRGCIGSLYPHQELWKEVIENSKNAAFHDPRFPLVTKEELNKINIEISILTLPKLVKFNNSEELLTKLKNKPGVILRKGHFVGTYLPQVWKQIPDKIKFLESLCVKAGLKKDDWKDSEILTYSVQRVSENNSL